MKPHVVGRAFFTPLGTDPGAVFERLLAGEHAVKPNDRFDASTYAVRLACSIPDTPPKPGRALRALRRIGLFGVASATAAVEDAGLTSLEDVGVFCGVGGLRASWDEMLDAWTNQQPDGAGAWNAGLGSLHPFWMLHHLSNNAHALVAQQLGAMGGGATYGGANGGAQALAGATRALRAGALETAVVFAYDSLLDPETLVELGERGAACTGDVHRAPYDARASGFVPGEAAAAVVLSTTGPGVTVDAFTTADGASGEPAARIFERFPRARFVDAAGLASPSFDAAERADFGPDTIFTCTQAAMGQLGAATSLVQVILAERALLTGRLPPIAGLDEPADGPGTPLSAPAPIDGPIVVRSVGAPGLAAAVSVDYGMASPSITT